MSSSVNHHHVLFPLFVCVIRALGKGGTNDGDLIHAAAFASNGSIILAGTTDGYNLPNLTRGTSWQLTKLDVDGDHVWGSGVRDVSDTGDVR